MTRTDRQQLVRDVAWRLTYDDRLARLHPGDLATIGSAINTILGWGVSQNITLRAARTLRALITKLDGTAEEAN